MYAPQLRAWRQAYSPSQLTVLMLSDLHGEGAAATLQKILHAIGLPSPRLHPDRHAALLLRASSRVAERARDATAAADGLPPEAARLLSSFYGRFAGSVRRELELMRQPLHQWRSREPWLWADGESALVATGTNGRRRRGGRQQQFTSSTVPLPLVRSPAAATATMDGGDDAPGLPHVFLLGGEKCGSTSLAFALSRHAEIRMARHALPGEPAYYRKEIHFFDDDLRYTRGLSFYAAHFPTCERGITNNHHHRHLSTTTASNTRRYWSEPPTRTSEVLLEDRASGEIVGWDWELNIPGDVARSVMVIPATEDGGGGSSTASSIGDGFGLPSSQPYSRGYWLVDSASSQLLYNRDWVLRAAPLTGEHLSDAKRFLFVPVPPADEPEGRQQSPSDGNAAAAAAPSFWLVDPSTQRLLYWRDDVIRVRPWRDRDPSASWRLRRLSDDECPHWASVNNRGGHNVSDLQWALEVAKTARGECTRGCEAGPLVRSIADVLRGQKSLSSSMRTAVCRATCSLEPPIDEAAIINKPAAVRPAPVSGCLCGSASRSRHASASGSSDQAGKEDRVWPDCGCRGGVGAHATLPSSMDATPMLHRLAAAWRMAASLKSSKRDLRFIVILREPAERAASHLGMLKKLAARGEAWAKLYVERHGDNSTSDGRLIEEADAFARCAKSRTLASGGSGGKVAASMGSRLSPKGWHECVAVACGFHACVVGQSIYEPQLRVWLNTFSAPQVLVLTLDEFAAAPSAALGRVTTFLGLGPFPRLVLNWKWTWNVGNQKKKRRGVTEEGLSRLRRFFSPYTDALGHLLRKRGQARAAITVDGWPRR